MNELNQIISKEIPNLEKFGKAFLNKELSKSDFKKQSGAFGVYATRNGQDFILRFRIPGGVISKQELRFIYNTALKYNLPTIHLTTRQCIQLHHLPLDGVITTIQDGLSNGLYTQGSGGNYPRNVAMSPLTGVTPGEAFDVLPFAAASNLHLLKSIHTYHLPRKFKVSFSNTALADAHSTIQDLGFIAMSSDKKPFFKVYVGGGLGKNPRCSFALPISLPPSDVLYVIEAMLSLFTKEGDYENHHKARIRHIVDRLGEEEFTAKFLEELEAARHNKDLTLPLHIDMEDFNDWPATLIHPRIFKQKQKGLYSMYFQPVGGQLPLPLLEKLLHALDDIPAARIRLTMTEGLYLINLTETEALTLLELTDKQGGETKLAQSVSCIGVPTCQMGILDSQQLLNHIVTYFDAKGYQKDILPRVYISGCPNSCGVHQIGSIGLTGKKKRVGDDLTECYTLYVGGSFHADHTRLGTPVGDIPKDLVPECLYLIAKHVEDSGENFDTWLEKSIEALPEILGSYMV